MSLPDCDKLTRKQFVFLYGVVGWGIPCALLSTLSKCWIKDSWDKFWIMLSEALIIWLLSGIIYGNIMWRVRQKKRKSGM